jgi:hypothetical protein
MREYGSLFLDVRKVPTFQVRLIGRDPIPGIALQVWAIEARRFCESVHMIRLQLRETQSQYPS